MLPIVLSPASSLPEKSWSTLPVSSNVSQL
jgi:hypothetical protein